MEPPPDIVVALEGNVGRGDFEDVVNLLPALLDHVLILKEKGQVTNTNGIGSAQYRFLKVF